MRPDNLRSNDPRHSLLKAPTAELCFNKCDHKCSKRAISRDFGLLDAGLRMINQEVKKMLDLSERILAKKWGVQTTHQRVLTRKRFHIRRRPSVPNEARTTRRLEFEPEELWPIRKGRCRSAAPDLIRRQHSTDHYGSYAERQNFWELDQTAQHNSALINEPNQSEVPERVSSLQDKNSQKPSRRNTIVSVNRKEEGQDETHHTLEPPDLMPRSPASTTWAKLSPERTISMDTLEILGAIERPDTIENLSRRQLEKEIHRSPSPINATTRPHRKETSKPLPNQEIAPVTQSAEPLTPASSSPNQTTYIVPIAYPSILYYPVAQPTTYTDFRSQAGVPPISANGVLVQSNPTSIMPVQQLCPPPIVYGSCVTPTLSPPVFQQTVFLPSTFHLLSYQAL
ncbi:unnamed protein product [Echinostoma caproni]|uniref:Uncharacterized protein n=1 Tax=Echinostoma caproni TaxID=27848 RepID=A0A183AB50_9TREM|nr:unnamed protein product [Echinostoma caproni]